MKKYTKIYLDHFNLDVGDYIPSEISGLPAVDIHHIKARQMGGSKHKDNIKNMMALTRNEHLIIESNPGLDWYFYFCHLQYMDSEIPWAQNPLSINDNILKEIMEKNDNVDNYIN